MILIQIPRGAHYSEESRVGSRGERCVSKLVRWAKEGRSILRAKLLVMTLALIPGRHEPKFLGCRLLQAGRHLKTYKDVTEGPRSSTPDLAVNACFWPFCMNPSGIGYHISFPEAHAHSFISIVSSDRPGRIQDNSLVFHSIGYRTKVSSALLVPLLCNS